VEGDAVGGVGGREGRAARDEGVAVVGRTEVPVERLGDEDLVETAQSLQTSRV